jgi:hypothetical protein
MTSNDNTLILGMAKSSLDLRGAKASKLELDFFKLAFAVQKLRSTGINALGYLLVVDKSVARAVEAWRKKYQVEHLVEDVLLKLPTPQERALLEAEKARNKAALSVIHDVQDTEKALSVASYGKKFGESALAELVHQLQPNKIKQIKDKRQFPLGIDWDFYGIVH